MKIRCIDGRIRCFNVSKKIMILTAYKPVWGGYYEEAGCLGCGEKFGVHDTKVLKRYFKNHVCKS